MSANPFDTEAIEPFIAFDLKRVRFSDDMDVVEGIDSRSNLLKLSPTEFEHPVQQLFVVMGAEAWTTCFEDLASSFHARKLLPSFTVRVSAAMDRQDWTINCLI